MEDIGNGNKVDEYKWVYDFFKMGNPDHKLSDVMLDSIESFIKFSKDLEDSDKKHEDIRLKYRLDKQ